MLQCNCNHDKANNNTNDYSKQLIGQWFEHMYLCSFVALSVQMFVVRANKVEGTMS